MKMYCMSLLDKLALSYGRPFFVANAAVAMRDIQDELKRGGDGNVLANHPGDFALYELGFFETDDGSWDLENIPRLLCEVSSLVESPPVGQMKLEAVS